MGKIATWGDINNNSFDITNEPLEKCPTYKEIWETGYSYVTNNGYSDNQLVQYDHIVSDYGGNLFLSITNIVKTSQDYNFTIAFDVFVSEKVAWDTEITFDVWSAFGRETIMNFDQKPFIIDTSIGGQESKSFVFGTNPRYDDNNYLNTFIEFSSIECIVLDSKVPKYQKYMNINSYAKRNC